MQTAHGNTPLGVPQAAQVCPPTADTPMGVGPPHPEARQLWGAGRLLTPLPSTPHTGPKHTPGRVPVGARPGDPHPPVAMPSKSESTRMGFLFSAGTGGYTFGGS